jgi:RNA polymerase sigma-70 factor (ECF subfamily)
MPLIYSELHHIAENAMRRESPGHTLQSTALIHETYLRLADQRSPDWKNRSQFFGLAAQVMRRVLVDHARERLAAKRGGDAFRLSLDNIEQTADSPVDVLDLHDALERLGMLDPLQSRVVEMRYFGGLNIEETAAALDVSPSTVKREWKIARLWLKRELS